MNRADIDVDVQSTFDPAKIFRGSVRASIYRDKKLTPHPCGVYLQNVPTDPVTGLAAAPYETAEELGCFKIDFLHLRIYDHFTSRNEITELLKIEPDWKLLELPSVVQQLFQLSKHYDVIQKVRPTSLIEVADVLALIRPQKRYMLEYYLRDRTAARKLLYQVERGSGGYAFKKSHALSYAQVIVLQLHLIKGGINFT